jgi:TolA protein
MSDRGGSLRWLFWPSLLVSVALHIGAVVALLLLQDERSGAVAQPTQAISVNIETTEVLESVEEAPSMTAAAGQAAPVPPEELKPEDKPEDQLPEPEPPAETPKEQPKPVEPDQPPPEPQPQPPEETAQEQPQPEPDLAAEREREKLAEEALRRAQAEEAERREAERREAEQKEAERKEIERKEIERKEAERREAERQEHLEREAEAREERERAEEREEARERARKRRQQLNAGASGSSGAQSSKARVSASQGAVRNYGGQVRACLNSSKPRSLGASGRVVIAIAISASGGLTSAGVVSSSGNSRLDQAAIATARRCSPFPQPPAGSSDGQRRFTIPFTFD